MNENLQYSVRGRKFTEGFEGLRLESYRDPRGVITIGFGHTGNDVHELQTCTQEEADAWLARDIDWAVKEVKRMVKVPLNQNQFDSLVDFVFNEGSGNFERSGLLRAVNAQHADASREFLPWNEAGGKVLPGLVRRRKAEAELFDTPI